MHLGVLGPDLDWGLTYSISNKTEWSGSFYIPRRVHGALWRHGMDMALCWANITDKEWPCPKPLCVLWQWQQEYSIIRFFPTTACPSR
jgi:hypothetical protein